MPGIDPMGSDEVRSDPMGSDEARSDPMGSDEAQRRSNEIGQGPISYSWYPTRSDVDLMGRTWSDVDLTRSDVYLKGSDEVRYRSYEIGRGLMSI